VVLLNQETNPTRSARGKETELLKRLQAGDEHALETLYSRPQPPVYRYALRMTGSESDGRRRGAGSCSSSYPNARGYDPCIAVELRSYL